jgi:hypothetical protein
MALFRPLCSLLIVALLTAGLFGAGLASAAHVQGNGEIGIDRSLSMEAAGAAGECCQDTSDRAASCTSVVGVVLDGQALSPSRGVVTTISVRPVGLSDGRDPHDLLDPPRTA